MKKAAERSAVRWSCAILAVLFFFLAACAWTLRNMQQNYGGDETKRRAFVNELYDEKWKEIEPLLQSYFRTGKTDAFEHAESFKPENTFFRFCICDAGGHVIYQTLAYKMQISYYERKEKTVIVSEAGFHPRTERVQIDCARYEPAPDAHYMTVDSFSRARTLVRIGTDYADYFWSTAIIAVSAALVCAYFAMRGTNREAKRTRGAERLFNALPPDLFLCCVLPVAVMLYKLLLHDMQDQEILQNYLHTGSGEYLFLLRPICLAGLFALLLLFLMLLVYSLQRGGIQYVFAFRRFVGMPFPRRSLLYLVVMQSVKTLAIALYLSKYTQWVVLFLLAEKLVMLPVVYRMLRQLRALMDRTARFVDGDLSENASDPRDYATLREHGADVDAIAHRISESAEKYVQSSQFKAELITNLSHDIKTPLTSIISYAQLLGRDDLSEADRAKYLNVLQRHSGRLQKLLDDLSEISDAASGSIPVQLSVVDLCPLVRQSAAGFEERLQKQDITLSFRMPAEPVYVTADPRLLQRVTDNLMNNISKYTRSGSEVQIAAAVGKSAAAVIFRNRSARPLTLSGEALMERFVREDSARHTDGSGLGLSIAQSLMQRQGGKLTLQTEGDVFTAQILFRKAEWRDDHAQ